MKMNWLIKLFKKGKYMPSLVSEIGDALELHLNLLSTNLEVVKKAANNQIDEQPKNTFPPETTLCKKCNHKLIVILDKCPTCLNCGDSKCG